MADALVDRLLTLADVTRTDGLGPVVEAIRSVPYGRPEPRTEEGLLEQWRGTCSTKHALLVRCLIELAPGANPRIFHRVYRITAEAAKGMLGPKAAAAVPPEGLTDVHTYVIATLNGRDVVLDVTFPGPPWDEASDMHIAASEGQDVPAGADPVATKAALVVKYCDPTLREPFIAALGM